MKLGINLARLTCYAPAQPLLDATATAAAWAWGRADAAGGFVAPAAAEAFPAPAADPDGYPTLPLPYTHADGHRYAPKLRLFAGRPDGGGAGWPAGTYTLSFAGSGTVRVDGAGPAPLAFAGAGSYPVPVPAPTQAGLTLTVAASDPADHVRDVRLTLPGFAGYEGEVYHPDYLDRLAPFGVIRFVDWQRAIPTAADPVRWADRTTPGSYTQAGGSGAAIERCVDLCNRLGRDPWLHVPFFAEPGYAAAMAALVKARLRPDLKVYVELGDELWNYAPPFGIVARAVEDYRVAVGLANHSLASAALRAASWAGWDAGWGGRDPRCLRVLASFFAVPWDALTEAQYLAAHADPADANRGFDVLAGAPYLNLPAAVTAGYSADTTPGRVVADYRGVLRGTVGLNAAGVTFPGQLAAFAAMRDKVSAAVGRRVPLAAYEFGLGTQPGAAAPWLAAHSAAAADPELYGLYREYLAALAGPGGFDLANHLNDVSAPGRFGAFGLLPAQDAASTPRYRALTDFLRADRA